MVHAAAFVCGLAGLLGTGIGELLATTGKLAAVPASTVGRIGLYVRLAPTRVGTTPALGVAVALPKKYGCLLGMLKLTSELGSTLLILVPCALTS